jgi:MinD-like ATPase involved in chromosome partitioning or flagellar assembly
MKLLLVSEDQRLFTKLNNSGYFQVQQQNNLHLLSQVNPNIIVISDRLIEKNELVSKLESLQETDYVFYMLSGIKRENENIRVICEAQNIRVIPPNLKESEILDQIIQLVYPQKVHEKNLFLFWGTDSKVGTTTVTQSIGQSLAENSDKKVLVISLCNKPNDQFIPDQNKTIDSIRTKLTTKVIDFEDILEASFQNKDFYFLPGPREIEHIRKYSLEDIVFLIDVLTERKDFIFLFDVGSYLDNPLTIAAFQRISNRFIVTTGLPSAISNFNQINRQIFSKRIFNFHSSDFLLIINKFNDIEDEEPTKIALEYGCTYIGYLSNTNHGTFAEKERKTITVFSEKFNEQIYMIAKIISTKAEATIQKGVVRKGIVKKIVGVLRGS